MIVGKKQLAEFFGVTLRTISEWQSNDTFPILRRNAGRGGNQYETKDVLEWYVQYRIDSDSHSLMRERARLAALQADAQELRNAEARQELIPAALALHEFRTVLKTISSRMAGVGVQVAPRVIGLEQLPIVAGEIDQGVSDALGIITPGLVFRVLGLPNGVATAAETSAVDMGGPLPTP